MKIIGVDVDGEKTDSMIINLFRETDNTVQSIVREYKGNIEDQSVYFAGLIESEKPQKVIINTRSVGGVLLNYLMKELEERNIYLGKNGNIVYRN